MKNNKGKSLAIFSAKGGTGKTSIAINFAGILSSYNKKILIIDFDLFNGGIAAYLNIEPKKSIYNLTDDYLNNRFMDFNDYIIKYNDNINILSCPKDPRDGAKVAVSYIDIIFSKAIYEYDYIVCDMDNSLSEFNISILDRVDLIYTVVTNDLLCLKNSKNLIYILNDANKKNYKVILNDSINPFKSYYSLYDVKNIIKANVDYHIPESFYLSINDHLISDGKIATLDNKLMRNYQKGYKTYVTMAKELMEIEDGK